MAGMKVMLSLGGFKALLAFVQRLTSSAGRAAIRTFSDRPCWLQDRTAAGPQLGMNSGLIGKEGPPLAKYHF